MAMPMPGRPDRVLYEYPSRSNPGKRYQIIEPMGGGEPYCTCYQWKINRMCKHLDDYMHRTGTHNYPGAIRPDSPEHAMEIQHRMQQELDQLRAEAQRYQAQQAMKMPALKPNKIKKMYTQMGIPDEVIRSIDEGLDESPDSYGETIDEVLG